MDQLDRAELERERALKLSIENITSVKVTPTVDCVDCGFEIEPERAKAIETDLCSGCAHALEAKNK